MYQYKQGEIAARRFVPVFLEAATPKSYPLYTLLIEVTKKCRAACDQCGSLRAPLGSF